MLTYMNSVSLPSDRFPVTISSLLQMQASHRIQGAFLEPGDWIQENLSFLNWTRSGHRIRKSVIWSCLSISGNSDRFNQELCIQWSVPVSRRMHSDNLPYPYNNRDDQARYSSSPLWKGDISRMTSYIHRLLWQNILKINNKNLNCLAVEPGFTLWLKPWYLSLQALFKA